MKRFLSIIAITAAGLPLAAGAADVKELFIPDVAEPRVLRSGNSLTVNFSVDPKGYKVSSNESMVLTPAIVSGADTVRLDPVTVFGRQAWYHRVRDGLGGPLLLRAGKGDALEYSRTIDLRPRAGIDGCLILVAAHNECGCTPDTPMASITLPFADNAIKNAAERMFRPRLHFIEPADTIEKNFTLSGRAEIRFKVNDFAIDWGFAGNHAELDSILQSVNAVRNNPDATVKEIHITGYASPEGSYSNNVRLAKGRTEVVMDYVRTHSPAFPTDVYHTSYVPEDWQGLREWIADNRPASWQPMIEFIDDKSISAPARNDLFARRFPKEYNMLLNTVYPSLRHTDYRISYNVRKYYEVEEIRRVAATNPRNLSQNELYILAKSYPTDSEEYLEAFSLAAKMFPTDETANLNAAGAAINAGDLTAASQYLERAGQSPVAIYNRGLIALLRKDLAKARPLLEKARDEGVEGAAEALREADAVERDMQLEY